MKHTELEQLNRILVGLVRQYGENGVLSVSLEVIAGVPFEKEVKWGCTGEFKDYIKIREK